MVYTCPPRPKIWIKFYFVCDLDLNQQRCHGTKYVEIVEAVSAEMSYKKNMQ